MGTNQPQPPGDSDQSGNSDQPEVSKAAHRSGSKQQPADQSKSQDRADKTQSSSPPERPRRADQPQQSSSNRSSQSSQHTGAAGTGEAGSGPQQTSQVDSPQASKTGTGDAGSSPQQGRAGPNTNTTTGTGASAAGGASPGSGQKPGAVGAGIAAAASGGGSDDQTSRKKKYTDAAVRSGAEGAVRGGFYGAAAGAAAGAGKEVGTQAAVDASAESAKRLSKKGKSRPGQDKDPSQHSRGEDHRRDRSQNGDDQAALLGAGGTSFERGHFGDEHVDPSGGGQGTGGGRGSAGTKKTAVAGAVTTAAPPAAFIAGLMLFLSWLKSMFFAAVAKAISLVQALWTLAQMLVAQLVSFVTKPLMAMAAGVSKMAALAFGSGSFLASTPVAAATVGVASAASATALVGGMLGVVSFETEARTGSLDDSSAAGCYRVGADGADMTTVSDSSPVSDQAEENAKAVYSVFKSWGMPEENIAGILGNWSRESGIDPTSVEGIFDEPYTIGPRKQAAWDSGFSHMGYVEHSGIGLGQWTGARNRLLIDYAKEKGAHWYDLGLQLRFMADKSGDNPSDVAIFRSMIKHSQGSPAEAAIYFHEQWERSADGAAGMAARVAKAEMWYAKMSGWEVNEGLVEQVVGDFVSGVSEATDALFTTSSCTGGEDGTSATIALNDGGMSKEQAQALIDLYIKEGDAFLTRMYHGGGPGQCNGSYVQNCVSFSTYFMNKYTTFQRYAPGNGVNTADSIASMTGRKTTGTPAPYSVFSHGNFSAAGHTGVVLGVNEDGSILIGEASYCEFPGRIRTVPKETWKQGNWEFVDVSDLLKDKESMTT